MAAVYGEDFILEKEVQNQKKAEYPDEIKISIIGYNETARSHAMNLRDFGFDVSIGVRPGKSWEKASGDGFEVYPLSDAAEYADIVSVTLPADILPGVYSRYIKNNLKRAKCLIFTDPSCLAHGILDIPKNIPAFGLLTDASGKRLRDLYASGCSIKSFLGPCNPPDENSLYLAREYAKGIGSPENSIFDADLLEISCASIFSSCHLQKFLEYFINCGINASAKEFSCTELSYSIIAEALLNAAETAGARKTSEEKICNEKSVSKEVKEMKLEDEMLRWIQESRSGRSLKDILLSNL